MRNTSKNRTAYLKKESTRLYLKLVEDANAADIHPYELSTIIAEWVFGRAKATENYILDLEQKATKELTKKALARK